MAEADATILAVPFDAVEGIIAAAGGFAGKVLIDATNPLGMREDGLGLVMGFNTSGAERIAALAPHAHVFKAFNQTGFENMAEARAYASRPVMFVAGNHEPTKPLVLQLVADAGFEDIELNLSDDGEDLSFKLRVTEQVAAQDSDALLELWIAAFRRAGFQIGFEEIAITGVAEALVSGQTLTGPIAEIAECRPPTIRR